jgi:hypothetical protein
MRAGKNPIYISETAVSFHRQSGAVFAKTSVKMKQKSVRETLAGQSVKPFSFDCSGRVFLTRCCIRPEGHLTTRLTPKVRRDLNPRFSQANPRVSEYIKGRAKNAPPDFFEISALTYLVFPLYYNLY